MPLSLGRARTTLMLLLLAIPLAVRAQTPAPKLISENGRHALLVDGTPYLVLGAQTGNSSPWPDVWPALEAMHVNTAEAPVYWEQLEPQPGQFDWANVDALIGTMANLLRVQRISRAACW
jgi:hypothetical protein